MIENGIIHIGQGMLLPIDLL